MLWWALHKLESDDALVRSKSLWQLERAAGRLQGNSRAVQAIAKGLRTGKLHLDALSVLGALSDRDAVACLDELLAGDRSEDLVRWLRSTKAEAWLAKTQDERLAPALIAALARWRHLSDHARALAETLAEYRPSAHGAVFEFLAGADGDAVVLVGQHLAKHPEESVRARLAALVVRRFFDGYVQDGLLAIVSDCGRVATGLLLDLVRDGSDVARRNAIKALQWNPRNADAARLRQALRDPATQVIAAGLLGAIGDPSAVGPLQETLWRLAEAGAEEARSAVQDALRRLGRPAPTPEEEERRQAVVHELVLRLATKSGRAATREELETFEPRWRQCPGATRAIPELAIAMAEGGSETFDSASWLLSQIDGNWRQSPRLEAVLPPLLAALDSPRESTRRRAAIVLEGVPDERCRDALNRLKTEGR